MALYHLGVFCGGIQVSISAVKNDRHLYHAFSKALSERLVGAFFTMKVHDSGIIIESGNISDSFLGMTIPIVYGNRIIELRVYPEKVTM